MTKKLLYSLLTCALFGAPLFAATDPNSAQISAVKEEIDREQGECICKSQKECREKCLACKKDASCCKNVKNKKGTAQRKKDTKKKTYDTKKCSTKKQKME